MEYLSIPITLFSSTEFTGAEVSQRSTWISLLSWCCGQENAGIIKDCRKWNMRRWMQTCGVMDSEVAEECELFRFVGDDLHVFGYPHEVQKTLEVKRDIARTNGKLGGRPRKTNIETNVGSEDEPTSVIEKTNVGTNVETNIESVSKVSKVSNIATTTSREVCQFPKDVMEIERFMSSQVMHPLGQELNDCAEAFFATFSARGWRDAKGVPITDWTPLARRYCANWARNNQSKDRDYKQFRGNKPSNNSQQITIDIPDL